MSAARLVAWTRAAPPPAPSGEVAEWLAGRAAPLLPPGVEPERAGVYVCTSAAGAEASVGLWAEALAQGPGFANPRDFPWTLASSVAGHLALRLGLRGPNYTLVGGSDAAAAALLHALDDLESGRVRHALVAGLDPPLPDAWRGAGPGAAALCLAAWKPGPGARAVERTAAPGNAAVADEASAAALLARACAAADAGEEMVGGHHDEGWIRFHPARVADGGNGGAEWEMSRSSGRGRGESG